MNSSTKKTLRILRNIFLAILCLVLVGIIIYQICFYMINSRGKSKLGTTEVRRSDSHLYRDLNKNGSLDIYEDNRKGTEARVEDLLKQMTLEEKVGLMFHPPIGIGDKGEVLNKPKISSFFFSSSIDLIANRCINTFNLFRTPSIRYHAEWYNKIQKLAEQTRLGIPITISSDPRHHLYEVPGMDLLRSDFSKWPNPIGLAATGDSLLVFDFAKIANEEYRAVGIRAALHPQVDLATEPRWSRIISSFGEDAQLSAKMTAAYIYGFQGEELGVQSVACMTKHWPGGGPQDDGWDAHFDYGAEQVYPGDNFDYHLIPFEAAFKAGTAMVMPYYGIPRGQTSEDVGMGFNKEIIQDLLRDHYGFDGVACTDWGIIGMEIFGIEFMGTPWGMEDRSVKERIEKVVNAGMDQLGGATQTGLLVELVKEGKISEKRIDESARRVLKIKFQLGLFDNPYIDPDKSLNIVAREDFIARGKEAQRKSIVLLKNDSNILPLKKGLKVYMEGIDPEMAKNYAVLASTPEEADLAILHLKTPHTKGLGNSFMERIFRQGDLDFKEPELSRILAITNKVPTVVCMFLERPAVLPEISQSARALLAEFGSDDDAILDVIFGEINPTAKLPFEMASSMEAVRKQLEDVPYDSENPLYPFGHGLTYGLDTLSQKQ